MGSNPNIIYNRIYKYMGFIKMGNLLIINLQIVNMHVEPKHYTNRAFTSKEELIGELFN